MHTYKKKGIIYTLNNGPVTEHFTPQGNFFWLHIKKVAGQSIRKALQPYYKEMNRRKPVPFSRVPAGEVNDWINNYRQRLGTYDFKRMLLAKEHIFSPQDFNALFKFVFVRNPYERAVSMFLYLNSVTLKNTIDTQSLQERFSRFLRMVPFYWRFKILFRHKALHTRPVLPDITDHDGKTLLVNYIGRLENFDHDVQWVQKRIGIPPSKPPHINQTKRATQSYGRFFSPRNIALIEKLYGGDIACFGYENACTTTHN